MHAVRVRRSRHSPPRTTPSQQSRTSTRAHPALTQIGELVVDAHRLPLLAASPREAGGQGDREGELCRGGVGGVGRGWRWEGWEHNACCSPRDSPPPPPLRKHISTHLLQRQQRALVPPPPGQQGGGQQRLGISTRGHAAHARRPGWVGGGWVGVAGRSVGSKGERQRVGIGLKTWSTYRPAPSPLSFHPAQPPPTHPLSSLT